MVVDIKTTSLKVGVRGKTPVIDGPLHSRVVAEDSMWSIDREAKHVAVHLEKANLKHEEWWNCVIEGHPKLNMKKLKPPSKSFYSLDGESQACINKMIFDQVQKSQGKPTSQDMLLQQQLANFQQQHPGQQLPEGLFPPQS
eukprot:Sspe_Gene.54484::Locus_30072_Transcript_1_1_Confidence_1.000_Length_806::g.54484::m.54484